MLDCLRDEMDQTDVATPTRPQDERMTDGDVGARGRDLVARVRANARETEGSSNSDRRRTNRADIAKGVGALAWMIAAIIYFAVHGLEFGPDASPVAPKVPATEAVWRPTAGVMPNGKPAGYWTLPDGFTFMGAWDIPQLRVQAIATALRRSRQQQSMQVSPTSARDPLDAYIASRLASGVSINELQALAPLINRGGVYPPAQYLPSYKDSTRLHSRYATPSAVPEVSSFIATGRTSLGEPESYAATHRMFGLGPAQGSSRGGFDTRFETYDPQAGSVGMINGRSGEYYAPAGPNGYVSTRNGTYYARSGPNGVIDTRTGQYVPTN